MWEQTLLLGTIITRELPLPWHIAHLIPNAYGVTSFTSWPLRSEGRAGAASPEFICLYPGAWHSLWHMVISQ